MKVFLSWSGERSHKVAELLRDWIQCVLQKTEPWISSRDIDRGALWFTAIGDQLKDTAVGIICLTADNKDAPWILFEAGALAKGLQSTRVCTLLVDLQPADIEDPLAQFNHTIPNRAGLLQLVETINAAMGNDRLEPRILEQVFETYWPKFEKEFETSKGTTVNKVTPSRTQPEILAEILENTRSLKALAQAAQASPPEHLVEPPKKRTLNSFRGAVEIARQGVLGGASNEVIIRQLVIEGVPYKRAREILLLTRDLEKVRAGAAMPEPLQDPDPD